MSTEKIDFLLERARGGNMAKTLKRLPFTVHEFMVVVRGNLGVVEKPKNSNRTRFGELYAKHTKGGRNGVAWCGIWSWANFYEAGVDIQKEFGFRWCAFTPTYAEDCRRAGWEEIAWKDIQEGDLLFWSFGRKRIDHTSIADGPVSRGRVPSDEGNTSSGVTGSQNNGGGSYRRKRTRLFFKTAFRPPFAVKVASKPKPAPAPAPKPKPTPKPAPKPTGKSITAILVGGAIVYGGVTYLPTTGPNAPKTPTVTITKTVAPAPKPTVKPKPTKVVKPAPRPTVVKRYVVVRRGDSLSLIAQREHTTWQKVAALNGLHKPWTVHPGEKVRVR